MYSQLPWENHHPGRTISTMEGALASLYLAIKFHNPTSLLNISAQDLKDLTANLREQYTPDLVMRAAKEAQRCFTGKQLSFASFLEKCAELHRMEDNFSKTEKLMEDTRRPRVKPGKEEFTKLKEMLANAIRPLPYDKNMREPLPSRYAVAPGESPVPARLRLHNDLVSYGQITHFDDVKNPELKALYYKAWTDGITREEKLRFKELGGTA